MRIASFIIQWKWSVAILAIVTILVLQVNKRNQQKTVIEKQEKALTATNSVYGKLLFQLPIYSDSTYKVYITKNQFKNKIVFLRKGAISERQKESSFFVHIYPKDKALLKDGIDHIPVTFKNNVTSFFYEGEKYFVSETSLPQLKIDKLNMGQYGFRGDNGISWRVPELVLGEKIAKILKENKENIDLFDLAESSF